MTIKLRDGSGVSTIGAIKIRTASGPEDVSQLSIRDGSGLHPMLVGMAATVSPASVYGYGYSAIPIRVTTSSCTVTVTGGTAPYSYFWETVEDDWFAVSPTAATTVFRSPTIPADDFATAVFTCTVTDSNGTVVVSSGVTANVSNAGV